MAKQDLVAVRTIPQFPINTHIHDDGSVWMGNDLITILSANQDLVVSKFNGALLFYVRDMHQNLRNHHILECTASI